MVVGASAFLRVAIFLWISGSILYYNNQSVHPVHFVRSGPYCNGSNKNIYIYCVRTCIFTIMYSRVFAFIVKKYTFILELQLIVFLRIFGPAFLTMQLILTYCEKCN